MIRIECGDCLEVMRDLPDNSVDLIATDPPYYRVKNEAWDRQWDNSAKFIEWIGELCQEWHRLLKPNGSLYVFASPKMAARVEVAVGDRFEVLNRIRWIKANGWHRKTEREALLSYLSPWEEIIFAEHKGSDFVCEPLRAWFVAERDRLGLTNKAVNELLGTATNGSGMAGHFFKPSGAVQWLLPTERSYRELQLATGGFVRKYDALRREYEALRRPFAVSVDVPYTDVWDFPTVSAYPGKHPCEKPLEMMRHIVRASSRPGAMVLDCFAGSGTTGLAAKLEGRSAILIEREPKWVGRMHDRLRIEQERPARAAVQPAVDELPLFARAVA